MFAEWAGLSAAVGKIIPSVFRACLPLTGPGLRAFVPKRLIIIKFIDMIKSKASIVQINRLKWVPQKVLSINHKDGVVKIWSDTLQVASDFHVLTPIAKQDKSVFCKPIFY